MKICLSVGHSETEQGAYNQTFGISEFTYNSGLVKLVRKQLIELGHEVVVVYRKELKDLPKQLNSTQADVCVEFHCNAFNKLVSGSEVLYYPTSTKGKKLARSIQDAIVDTLDLRDRGCVGSERELILRKTVMPCVIVEPGFIDNDVDMLVLQDMKEELAIAIASGIHEYSLSN